MILKSRLNTDFLDGAAQSLSVLSSEISMVADTFVILQERLELQMATLKALGDALVDLVSSNPHLGDSPEVEHALRLYKVVAGEGTAHG